LFNSLFSRRSKPSRDYEPYLGTVVSLPWLSPDAGAIAAAHRTLVVLRPGSAATFDLLRDQSLAVIPDGPLKAVGIAVGIASAAAMLVLRSNDGSVLAASVPYTPGTGPGAWQPTPPALAPAFPPGWGLVTPFGLEEGSQFCAPPPPALITGRDAMDYNEVKLVGGIDSPFRPQDLGFASGPVLSNFASSLSSRSGLASEQG
jgi:hypothetical protein